MISFCLLLLAAVTPPIPTARPTATPWAPRRPPTPAVLHLMEPTPAPVDTNLSDIAGRLKLKREDAAAIMITGHGMRNVARNSPMPGARLGPELGEIEVVAYKKGPGIEAYIVAKDLSSTEVPVDGYYGLIITARGTRVVDIPCPWGAPGCGREEKFQKDVYFSDGAFAVGDFQTITVGIGAFAHPRLLRPFGVISFADMMVGPVNTLDLILTVIVEPNGRMPVTGSTTVTVR